MTIQRITFSSGHQARQTSLHSRQPLFGSNLSYPVDIIDIIDSINPASVLDYGCGKGFAGLELAKRKQIKVSLYDPFIEDYNKEPAPADLVICWNVINNVEEHFLPAVIDHLYELTYRDLIVKFPLQKNNDSYYLDQFKKFTAKSITQYLVDITVLDKPDPVKKPTMIFTGWFVK